MWPTIIEGDYCLSHQKERTYPFGKLHIKVRRGNPWTKRHHLIDHCIYITAEITTRTGSQTGWLVNIKHLLWLEFRILRCTNIRVTFRYTSRGHHTLHKTTRLPGQSVHSFPNRVRAPGWIPPGPGCCSHIPAEVPPSSEVNLFSGTFPLVYLLSSTTQNSIPYR